MIGLGQQDGSVGMDKGTRFTSPTAITRIHINVDGKPILQIGSPATLMVVHTHGSARTCIHAQ